jgi:hypothetical protein
MNDKLTHRHFKLETRLPHPGERIIFCSCFGETLISEPCEEKNLGCRVRVPAPSATEGSDQVHP